MAVETRYKHRPVLDGHLERPIHAGGGEAGNFSRLKGRFQIVYANRVRQDIGNV